MKKNKSTNKRIQTSGQKKDNSPLLWGLAFGIAFGFLLQKGGATKYDVIVAQLLLSREVHADFAHQVVNRPGVPAVAVAPVLARVVDDGWCVKLPTVIPLTAPKLGRKMPNQSIETIQ